MNYIVTAYCIYLPLMLALTIWVANTIHKNTRTFLVEIFPGHETVASAVNNLLQTGFYLLALGFGFLRLYIQTPNDYGDNTASTFMTTEKELVEALAMKLGSFTLFIGFLLFFNLILMLILRKGAKNTRLREEQTRIWIQKQQEYQQMQQQQQQQQGNYGAKK